MYTTKAQIIKQHNKNQRDLVRLYNTMTPMRTIKKLERDIIIAYQNELRSLQERSK